MTITHVLPDGRRLTLEATGPDDGRPVLLLHSAPGSRLLDPDPAVTTALGVRLLTVDRPGYGGSDPLPDGAVPTLGGVADDIAHAVTALGLAAAHVVGWSHGGRVATALAARHPHLVASVALVGTPAPDTAVAWIPAEHRAGLVQLAGDLPTATGRLAAMFLAAGRPADPTAAIAAGPADEAVLTADGALRGRVQVMLAEAGRQGPAGSAADVVAANLTDPGHTPDQVRVPVRLVYSRDDTLVRPEHADWWATELPDARVHLVAGVGHLLLLTHWRTCAEPPLPVERALDDRAVRSGGHGLPGDPRDSA